MKKLFASATLLFGFGFAVSSYGASNEETLKHLYESGTEPALPSDFPERDYYTGDFLNWPSETCAVVGVGDYTYPFNISRTVRTTLSSGPLVPGKTEVKLLFGDAHLSFDHMEAPTTVDKDLVLNNPIYRTWTNGNNGTINFIPAQLYARRSGDFLAFRLSIPHGIPGFLDEEYYGYCYQGEQTLLY